MGPNDGLGLAPFKKRNSSSLKVSENAMVKNTVETTENLWLLLTCMITGRELFPGPAWQAPRGTTSGRSSQRARTSSAALREAASSEVDEGDDEGEADEEDDATVDDDDEETDDEETEDEEPQARPSGMSFG